MTHRVGQVNYHSRTIWATVPRNTMNRWTETHTDIRGQCSFNMAILQVHILIAAHASLHLVSFGRGKVRSALIDQLAASIAIVELLN